MNLTIPRHLGHSNATIRRCWQERINNGRYQGQRVNGRLRATVEQEDRAIVRSAATAPDTSLSTTYRVACTLVQHDPRHMTERVKFMLSPIGVTLTLTPVHRQIQLECYGGRSTRNCADWWGIVFSDESCFQLCPYNNRRHVLRHPGLLRETCPDYCKPHRPTARHHDLGCHFLW